MRIKIPNINQEKTTNDFQRNMTYIGVNKEVKCDWKLKKIMSMLCIVIMMTSMLSGCGMVTVSEEKIRDLDYTVLCEKELPEELLELITQKKVESFKMTFEDKGFLYICQGYGEQPTAGYSICVDDAYVTSNAIYFSTSLIGPETGEPKTTQPTYPYIVIKTEMQDTTVVFGD